jgi:hypothetical protein
MTDVSRLEPPDPADVDRDDELLTALASGGYDAGPDTDPAITLLAELRADVDVSDDDFVATADTVVIPMTTARRRLGLRHGGRTVAVASVATLVLSAGGVAAAGIASHPGQPLYEIHKIFLGGPSASQRAAQRVGTMLDAAGSALDGHQLPAARVDLSRASATLVLVHRSDRGDLPGRLAGLESRYAAALAALTPGTPGLGPDDNGSTPGGGDRGEHGSGDHGQGNGGEHGKGSGRDHGNGSGGDHGNGNGSGGDQGKGSGGDGGKGTGGDGGKGTRGKGTGGDHGGGSSGDHGGGSSGDHGNSTGSDHGDTSGSDHGTSTGDGNGKSSGGHEGGGSEG